MARKVFVLGYFSLRWYLTDSNSRIKKLSAKKIFLCPHETTPTTILHKACAVLV